MSAVSGVTLRRFNDRAGRPIINPYVYPSCVKSGCSYGESHAGYDIRLGCDVQIEMGYTTLAVSLEEFRIPDFLKAEVKDKSTLCRKGITVQNTVIEPGWRGFLTLELKFDPVKFIGCELNPDYDSHERRIFLNVGDPIAQIVFYTLTEVVEGYSGKYQGQGNRPTPAILE